MMMAVNLDKLKIKQSFSNAAHTYDGFAILQGQIAKDLIGKFEIKSWLENDSVETVIDIGCGTGFLTAEILKYHQGRVVALDLSHAMLSINRAKFENRADLNHICADAENLPLREGCTDLIFSSSTLQWCQNLPDMFLQFNNVLSKKGKLCMSLFGESTLQELKSAWAQVDQAQHVNHFYSADQIYQFLVNSGFCEIQITKQRYQLHYHSVLELKKALKGIGAQTIISRQTNHFMGKKAFKRLTEAYEQFAIEGLLPATYEVVFVSACTESL